MITKTEYDWNILLDNIEKKRNVYPTGNFFIHPVVCRLKLVNHVWLVVLTSFELVHFIILYIIESSQDIIEPLVVVKWIESLMSIDLWLMDKLTESHGEYLSNHIVESQKVAHFGTPIKISKWQDN